MIHNSLILSVSPFSWQKTDISHGSLLDRQVTPDVIEIYKKVMERDKYTCYYCGFESKKFQEVHHLNDNHNDHTEENLVTVCPLCHQSHHLNSAAINNGAELIWLPELTQAELNHLCRVLFVANQIKEDSGNKNKHFIINNSLAYIWQTLFYSRKKVLDTKISEGCSDLGKFAQVLLDIRIEKPKVYEKREIWLKNFKLLHNPNRFQLQTQYWKENEFKDLEIHKWVKLASKLEINMPEKEFKDMNNEPIIDLSGYN